MNVQQSALAPILTFDWPRGIVFALLALVSALTARALALPEGHCVSMSLFGGIIFATFLLAEPGALMRWAVLAFFLSLGVDAGIQRAPIFIALADASGHVAGMLLAVWLVRRCGGGPFGSDRLRDVLLVSAFIAVPGALVSALVECAIGIVAHGGTSVVELLRTWTNGMVGIVPAAVMLTLVGNQGRSDLWAPGRRMEGAVLMILLALGAHWVFRVPMPLVYLLLPLFVWSALRFDMVAMSIAIAVVAVIALYQTALGMGPYAALGAPADITAIQVQALLYVVVCGGLVMSAVMMHRRNTLRMLLRAQSELEERVQIRTAALRESEARLRANEERFALARAAAKIIVVDWDIQNDELTYSDSPEWLRGPLPASGKYPLFKDQVHAEDRDYFLKMRDSAVRTLRGEVVRYRFVRTDGVVRHIESFQTMLAGPDGKAQRLVAIQQDVSEREQAQSALRESEQRLRTLLDAIPDQVRMKDKAGRYLMVNRAAREHLGRPEAEITGRTIYELRPRHIAEKIDSVDQEMLKSDALTRVERPSFFYPDVWREEINAPMRDAAGAITGYVSISRDITERKRAETALRESEQRLRVLLDAIPDEVRLKDSEGRYLMVNRAVREQIGRPESEIFGKTVYDFLPPDQALQVDADHKRALAAAGPLRAERVGFHGEGSWWEVVITPIRDASGGVIGSVSISRDISERKAAELETLRQREEQYRNLVEQATDLIYRTDPYGYFTYFNSDAALVRLVGYSREELLGRNYLDYVHPDYRARTDAFYRRQFAERATATYFEFPALTKDGRTVWVGQQVNVFVDNGRVIYHQGVCRDINERVAAQQALRDSNDRLRWLAAHQEALLEAERSRLAHDLHDGIGQSINLARIKLKDLMLRREPGALEPGLGEVVTIMDETRAVIRTLEFDLSPPVLRELGLDPALEWLAEQIEQDYGLRVSLSRDDEPVALSQAQRAVVFRAVREMLINVARHARVREAHVDTQCQGERLVVTVSDEGCGFDTANAAKGLGLTGVQERFTHLGGGVDLSSAPGEGTVVTLWLPINNMREGVAG